MSEAHTSGTAPWDSGHAAEDQAAIAVERGLFELSRGRPVYLADGGGGLLVLAADAGPAAAAGFPALAQAPVSLMVSARRAAALGLPPQPHLLPWGREGSCAAALAALAVGHPEAAGARARLAAARPTGDRLTEAALRLARLAETLPVFYAARLPAGPERRLAELLADGRVQRVAVAGIETTTARPPGVVRLSAARVPLRAAGQARFLAYRRVGGQGDDVAVVVGSPEAQAVPLVRLHSACLTGDVFASRRCDCGDQLSQTLARMAAEGAGVICYLAQEGRGIGIVNKLRAYALQDEGLDTLEANEALGFERDERDYAVAAEILKDLGLRSVRLMTNNPAKVAALQAAGLEVCERVALEADLTGLSARYLRARVEKAGYLYGPTGGAAEGDPLAAAGSATPFGAGSASGA